MLQMRHALADGKVFLRRGEIVPARGAYAPFHPRGRLIAGQPRPAAHDRGEFLNAALMVIYKLLGALGKGNAADSSVSGQSRFYRQLLHGAEAFEVFAERVVLPCPKHDIRRDIKQDMVAEE